MLAMLERCDDHVAAFLMAVNAFTPDEVRSLAFPLGVPEVDDLRELTALVVVTARRVEGVDEQELRKWITVWSRSPRDAASAYLRR